MTATVQSMPGCCSAKLIVNLGHSTTSAYGHSSPDKKTLAGLILDKMKTYSQEGFLQIVTTTQQKLPNEVLEELGWKKLLQSRKLKHSENELCLWVWQPLEQDPSKPHRPVEVPRNPFATTAAVPATTRAAGYAPRELHNYLRPPVGVWIHADGTRPCPETILNRKISIRTNSDSDRRPDIYNTHEARRFGWSYPLSGGTTICAVYIHP